VLFVFLVLVHERRRVVHFNVTEYPCAARTAQQIIEAFPEDTAPRYMIRDRDDIYGEAFCRRIKNMGIEEVLTAPQSPWQNPYAERPGGLLRRECLDHVIVLGERHLHRILRSYFAYYQQGAELARVLGDRAVVVVAHNQQTERVAVAAEHLPYEEPVIHGHELSTCRPPARADILNFLFAGAAPSILLRNWEVRAILPG
jgi:transposase InsO family protein